jgi:TFIIF-interacting CTD phosphatase-like protein
MSKNKKNLLLDLDQTLICACDSKEYKPGVNKKMDEKADNEIFNKINMDDIYIIFQRPNLDKFLDFIFENFNVSVWTAASKDYALFIINKIILKLDAKSKDKPKKKRKIDYVFFSYHCDISKKIKKGTKDLSILWDEFKIPGYSKDNTFIIDDYSEVYKTQPKNCIQIPEFNFTDESCEDDSELIKIQLELEKIIKKSKKLSIDDINKKLKKS